MDFSYGMSSSALSPFASVLSVVLWVLYIIGFWKMFSKSGEAGWKSIIPIYNQYVYYKITWKASMFWATILLWIVSSILIGMSGATYSSTGTLITTGANTAMIGVAGILMIVAIVIYFMQSFKASRAYGHGAGFAWGLILFNPIFVMILGLGNSQYKGPQA